MRSFFTEKQLNRRRRCKIHHATRSWCGNLKGQRPFAFCVFSGLSSLRSGVRMDLYSGVLLQQLQAQLDAMFLFRARFVLMTPPAHTRGSTKPRRLQYGSFRRHHDMRRFHYCINTRRGDSASEHEFEGSIPGRGTHRIIRWGRKMHKRSRFACTLTEPPDV